MGLLYSAPRLGLAENKLPHADRHSLLHIRYCQVTVEDGRVQMTSAGSPELPAGVYALPYQTLSMLMLGPGCSISQDALRILARHHVGVIAVGEGGTRSYSAPPWGASRSDLARQHALLWADPEARLNTARRMYALRFGELLPHRDIEVLRGIEGGRVKKAYQVCADQVGLKWVGRHYDRSAPEKNDIPNQALNFVSSCVESAAEIAVYSTGAIPALGFIHEDAASAFTLDIADLYRAEITIRIAFKAAKDYLDGDKRMELERVCRRACVDDFNRLKLISQMIDRIKLILTKDSGP